jgi:hypothetical protein
MKLTTTVALVRVSMCYEPGDPFGYVLMVPRSGDAAYLVPLRFGGVLDGDAPIGPVDSNVVELVLKSDPRLFKIPRTRDEHKVNLTCLADTFKFQVDDASDYYVFLVE